VFLWDTCFEAHFKYVQRTPGENAPEHVLVSHLLRMFPPNSASLSSCNKCLSNTCYGCRIGKSTTHAMYLPCQVVKEGLSEEVN